MAELHYLLDEHLRGPLWKAIQKHNRAGDYPLDVVRVGDPAELQLGAKDPEVLVWAESQQRLFISFDRDTLGGHLQEHLASGRTSPGIFLLRSPRSIPEIIDYLIAAAYASTAEEWRNRLVYIP